MKIKLHKDVAKEAEKFLKKTFGVDLNHWSKEYEISLDRHPRAELESLIQTLEPLVKMRSVKTAIGDIKLWFKVLGGEDVKPRSMEQARTLLEKWLLSTLDENVAAGRPYGVRLYKQNGERDIKDVYHVSGTKYHTSVRRDGYTTPAHIDVGLACKEFGRYGGHSFTIFADHIDANLEKTLANLGYLSETKELWDEYQARLALFDDWSGKIGKQFLARGTATDDCDGNPKTERDSWFFRREMKINLEKNNEPSRVVVDVFFEDDDKARGRRDTSHSDTYWESVRRYLSKSGVEAKKAREDDEEGEDLDDEDTSKGERIVDGEDPVCYVPVRPNLAMFDMKRHLRLRIDVGQLEEYPYDANLGEKLILPKDSRNLVEMLLAHKGQFRDIVHGKSGGAIILCAGLPGTGKTLTAEVYAEVMARPLYTIQASQLGTDPNELEEEMLKSFARASRWNAIMLLDEADVYVRARGSDLAQNAIVGVFLRVLEYYKGVLFMTTNRSDLVDDAIASRCIARIDYKAPPQADQRAIWKVLTGTSGITIKDKVIDEIVDRYPELTGRDVKNLIKLAKLVSDSRDCEITLDVIRFVKRFKPTIGEGDKRVEDFVELPEVNEAAEDEHPAAEDGKPRALSMVPAEDWKAAAEAVFNDGAPHPVSEAKEAVAKVAPDVHPNAVTNVIKKLVAANVLERMPSGLYRRPAAAEKMAG